MAQLRSYQPQTATRIATVDALTAAVCSTIRIQAHRRRPLPLLADVLARVDLDELVSWRHPNPIGGAR